MKKKIAVFGGSGFIGTNLIALLLKKKYQIINFDKLSYCSVPEKLKNFEYLKNYKFKKLDMQNFKTVCNNLLKFKPDIIFNLASETHVDRSIDNPKNFIKNNIILNLNLLDSAKKLSKKKKFKFINMSTDEVYGSINKGSFVENDILCPNSPYAASKASNDLISRSYIKTFGINLITVRSCNNFGPFQFTEKFIPTIIYMLINQKKIPIYGKGQNTREWIFVEDCAYALYKIMIRGKNNNTYNIGSGDLKKNIDIAKYIFNYLKKKNHINKKNFKDVSIFVKDRPGHDFRYSVNSMKIKRHLGLKFKKSFLKNLNKTIEWYIANKEFMKYCNSKYKGERLGDIE